MTLKFSEKAHKYWLDGQSVPGVTTLLRDGLPKPQIPYWSARMVAEWVADYPEQVEALREGGRGPMVSFLKGVPWEKRDQAAIRGTEVHAIAERIIHGEQVEVPDLLLAHVEGLVDLLDRFKVEPILTEVPVASRQWWYAGRLDAIVRMGGETWLVDLKTSNGVYGETALQTAGYARAEFYAPTPDEEVPLPLVQRIGVIHVTSHGSYLHDLGDVETAFKVFTHVQFVAKQKKWLDGLIGDPLTPEALTGEVA